MTKTAKGKQKTVTQRATGSKRQKRIWTTEEDEKLLQLIERFGAARWSMIAGHVTGRQGKQCRERWHNHLNPAISKESWAEEEEWLLFLLHKMYGSRWAVLAQMIAGRTDNTIKNHWNSIMRRKVNVLEARLQQTIAARAGQPPGDRLEDLLIHNIANKEGEEQGTRKGRKRSCSRFFEQNPLEQFIARRALPAEPVKQEESPIRLTAVIRTPGKPDQHREFLYQLNSHSTQNSPGELFSVDRCYANLFGTEDKNGMARMLHYTPQKAHADHLLESSFGKYFRRTEEAPSTPHRLARVGINAFDSIGRIPSFYDRLNAQCVGGVWDN